MTAGYCELNENQVAISSCFCYSIGKKFVERAEGEEHGETDQSCRTGSNPSAKKYSLSI